jgi:pyruvate dehydrogenase E1 component
MVSTNLSGWVNRRKAYSTKAHQDAFTELGLSSMQGWSGSPAGQHIELGIAENNFFLMLAALGLTGPLFGVRLFPIGTIYDTFIQRGLDALNYACYQDSRFILVGTPSGITLAPEGGAHQSITTPLIGIGQPQLASFEPAYADELTAIMHWALQQLHRPDGSSVYLRLSTRPIPQPNRELSKEVREAIVAGGYWLIPPPDAAEFAIFCSGAVATEAIKAYEALSEEVLGMGVAIVTSADRLYTEWSTSKTRDSRITHVEKLLAPLSPNARIITVIDGHPLGLSWLGSVRGQRMQPLGVQRFGQCGNISDLYREYKVDADAIIEATARACLEIAGWVAED